MHGGRAVRAGGVARTKACVGSDPGKAQEQTAACSGAASTGGGQQERAETGRGSQAPSGLSAFL